VKSAVFIEKILSFSKGSVITAFFVEDLQILHNWIPNAPYSGLNVGEPVGFCIVCED